MSDLHIGPTLMWLGVIVFFTFMLISIGATNWRRWWLAGVVAGPLLLIPGIVLTLIALGTN